MCNAIIKPMIENFKKQDMTVFPLVYSQFGKLISFYSRKLSYEDSASDLTVFLIELLYDIDLGRFPNDSSFGVKKYIAVSLRNYYIALSKKMDTYKQFSNQLYENLNGYCENLDDKLSIMQCLDILTEKQKTVLIYKYVYGYSDFEIANLIDVSRQAVNRIKNRGLTVLKEFFEGGEYGL